MKKYMLLAVFAISFISIAAPAQITMRKEEEKAARKEEKQEQKSRRKERRTDKRQNKKLEKKINRDIKNGKSDIPN